MADIQGMIIKETGKFIPAYKELPEQTICGASVSLGLAIAIGRNKKTSDDEALLMLLAFEYGTGKPLPLGVVTAWKLDEVTMLSETPAPAKPGRPKKGKA